MTVQITAEEARRVRMGWDPDPARAHSLNAEAYTDPRWHGIDREAIIAKTWQWLCHAEKLRAPGSYVTAEIAGRPVCAVRDSNGELRAFYNVCKHRAHELLRGEGAVTRIMSVQASKAPVREDYCQRHLESIPRNLRIS